MVLNKAFYGLKQVPRQWVSMSVLGDIHHFIGINVHRNTSGLLLSQQQYVFEILDRANMLHCNPI